MAKVRETISLGASAAEVWSLIGDFNGLDGWHPAVATCEAEARGDSAIRHLTLGDGAKIIERLDEHDDAARRYTYSILDAGPLPVQDYQSTIEVSGDGGTSTVTWSSRFNTRGAPEADAQAAISGVYQGGFATLAEKFGAG